MILSICLGAKKDAVGDLYKDIMNNFPEKEKNIIIIPNAYNEKEFSNDFFKILREKLTITKGKYNKIKGIYKLLKLINKLKKKYNIDNIYIHTEEYFSFLFLLTFFIKKNNTTLWFHDPILHEGSPKIVYLKRKIAYLTYLKYVKHLIISYNNVIKEIKNDNSLQKISKKFKVLYLPQMKEMEFEDIKNNASIKLKYDFIFYGRIEEYKGLDLLLEVFKDREMQNIRLLIVGRGRKDKEIKDKIKNIINITFINEYVPNRDLAKYIMESKFVILPYKTATGTQTIQIANYYNKMVLTTKVGCFTEYIKEGKNGLFINRQEYKSLKEAILNAMKYKIDDRQKLLINEEYKKFDLIKTANKLYSIINS